MAVRRAWVDGKGEHKTQLTDEQMSQFLNKVVSGLNDLAQTRVMEELKPENRVAEAAGTVVAYVR
jgi:hypothetical protein